jgi:hypothetical protein
VNRLRRMIMPLAEDGLAAGVSKVSTGVGNPDVVVLDDELIINETLCFALGIFPKTTIARLKSILNSFYTADEIIHAKETLISSVTKVDSNILPRYGKRKGDNRGKLSVDDICDIISTLDENQLLNKLPKFVAVSIDRIPTTRADDIDIVSLCHRLDTVEARLGAFEALYSNPAGANNKLDQIDSRIASIENHQISASSLNAPLNQGISGRIRDVLSTTAVPMGGTATTDQPVTQDYPSRSVTQPVPASAEEATNTDTSVSRPTQTSDSPVDDFVTVVRRKTGLNGKPGPAPDPVRGRGLPRNSGHTLRDTKHNGSRVFGSSSVIPRGGLKSGINIVRKSVLHVDNLDAECTEETLRNFLHDINVKVFTCFRAKSWLQGEERDFVCAYRVCIDANDKSTMCSATLWPHGIIIRDWVFKTKNE